MEFSMEELDFFDLVFIIALLLIFIFMIFFAIYFEVSKIIHKTYHEGYNEAKNTNISYYSTLYTVKTKFENLMTLLEKLEIHFPVLVYNEFNKFIEMLGEYQEVDFKKS